MSDTVYRIESGTGRRGFGWFVLDVVSIPEKYGPAAPRTMFVPVFEDSGVIPPENVREGQYRIVETSTVAEVLDS